MVGGWTSVGEEQGQGMRHTGGQRGGKRWQVLGIAHHLHTIDRCRAWPPSPPTLQVVRLRAFLDAASRVRNTL